MSGDSVSIPTNVVHSDTVSRVQQAQVTDNEAQEKFAKKLREQSDDEEALTKNVSETQRQRLKRKREDEESRQRREQQRQKGKPDAQGRGGKIDLKV